MAVNSNIGNLLIKIRDELESILGEDIDQILLYGSHARGDELPDSDVDLLVVLNREVDYAKLLKQTSEAIARISLDHDIVISRSFISKERFMEERTPFVLNVKREGIAI